MNLLVSQPPVSKKSTTLQLDSEELMKLLREQNIQYKPFDAELAGYVARAMKEKR